MYPFFQSLTLDVTEDVSQKDGNIDPHTSIPTKPSTSEDNSSKTKIPVSSGTVHASYTKIKTRKKASSKQLNDGIVFNNTFLDDSDL